MDLSVLRQRFAELDTEALWAQWRVEARVAEAEAALRQALIERGAQEAALDEIAARRAQIARDTPPSERDTLLVYGILGRFVALFLAIGVGNVVGNVLGRTPAVLAVTSIGLAYLVIMGRRALLQFRHGTSGLGGLVLAYQCIELLVIALVCLAAMGWLLARGI
jgi:hypothetical protein